MVVIEIVWICLFVVVVVLYFGMVDIGFLVGYCGNYVVFLLLDVVVNFFVVFDVLLLESIGGFFVYDGFVIEW